MKKPYRYTEKDNRRICVDCKKPLKKNLLAKRPNADKCYSCFNPKRKAHKLANKEATANAIANGKIAGKSPNQNLLNKKQ